MNSSTVRTPARLIFALVVSTFAQRPLATARPAMTGDLTKALGESVLTTFVLPFELLALLMVAALLAAIYFARPAD